MEKKRSLSYIYTKSRTHITGYGTIYTIWKVGAHWLPCSLLYYINIWNLTQLAGGFKIHQFIHFMWHHGVYDSSIGIFPTNRKVKVKTGIPGNLTWKRVIILVATGNPEVEAPRPSSSWGNRSRPKAPCGGRWEVPAASAGNTNDHQYSQGHV